MEYITADNYGDMRKRVNQLDNMDNISGSSNFGKLMEWLEGNDIMWIAQINDRLEQN